MHVLVSQVGDHNAVVASYPTLAKLMGVSVITIRRSIEVLKNGNWIEVRRIGGSGTANAYIVNDRVAWTDARDNLPYSLFSAKVIASSEEQPDKDMLGKQEPLRWLPKIGEIQNPTGDGLPPPSQPHLPSMEPDLPAASNLLDDRLHDEHQLAMVDFLNERVR
ncbi:hypothetical protein [Bartonella sp. DGB2]|uniref:hypothetical protein n=1 Tax=Bartonella sp. DGB2 TaxID=3388426 RepID=UPI00398FED64